MESLQGLLPSNAAESALSSLINSVVLAFMTEYFSVCIIRSKHDKLTLHIPTPSLSILVDGNFASNFQRGVDAGCQAFIVENESVWPFLDSFTAVHDFSDQRFSGKKLIVLLDGLDVQTTERLCQHYAMRGKPFSMFFFHNPECMF